MLVERSELLRTEQRDLLAVEPADEALGPVLRSADPDEDDERVPGTGPIVASIDELPGVVFQGVVLANELLDNLPVRIVQATADGWAEVRVGLEAERLAEVLVPADPTLAAEAAVVADGTPVAEGVRLPVPTAIADWLAAAAAVLRRGEVVLLDYADGAAGLARRPPTGTDGWLRTYRLHERGGDALDRPGTQDITADLPLEYLRAVATRSGFAVAAEVSQAEWLRGLGVDDLVEEGRAVWRERAHLGDLEAIAGRSRVGEAEALLDPAGLGAHRVITLERSFR